MYAKAYSVSGQIRSPINNLLVLSLVRNFYTLLNII